MKRILLLLGLTFSLTAPLLAQNTPGNESTPPRRVQGNTKTGPKTISRAPQKSRCVYYITSVNVTGSHLPLVMCRYEGYGYYIGQSSPGSRYSSADIGVTGALSVGGALRELDPAISSTVGHR